MYNEDNNRLERSMDLDLLEERRIASRLKSELFKQRIKKEHDKKVYKRPLEVRD